jgi:hypothetical protein
VNTILQVEDTDVTSADKVTSCSSSEITLHLLFLWLSLMLNDGSSSGLLSNFIFVQVVVQELQLLVRDIKAVLDSKVCHCLVLDKLCLTALYFITN